MILKRSLMFIMLLILAFSLLNPILVSAKPPDVLPDGTPIPTIPPGGGPDDQTINDGYITVEDGVITLTGPVGIKNQKGAMGHVISKYKKIITFIGGMITVSLVGIFIFQFVQLGATATNPMERKKVLIGLLISGISAALLGSVTLFVGIFMGMWK